MFALFFPMFTGILSGANRAETLADPHRDIPRGTFLAISFSFVLYIALFTLYGSMSDRDYLSGALCTCNATCAGLDTWCPQASLQCLQPFQVPECTMQQCTPQTTGHFGSGEGVACPTGVANQTNVDCRIAFFENAFLKDLPNNYFLGSCPITNAIGIPSAQLLNWCIFMACLAQVLQCYINAGLLLRALGEDDIAPFLNFLRHTHEGEPKVAFAICFVFTTGLSMIGSIDFLAIAMSSRFRARASDSYIDMR